MAEFAYEMDIKENSSKCRYFEGKETKGRKEDKRKTKGRLTEK